MAKMPEQKKVDEAIAVLDGVAKEWLRRPGVTAVDVGFKMKHGEMTDQIAIRAHVERKLPPDQVAESDTFNTTGKRVKTLGGFPVDVIEAKYGVGYESSVHVMERVDHEPIALEEGNGVESAARQRRVRPLMGGLSCGNGRITAGTLGAIVYNKATCKQMILSNWHVLAGSTAARVGEAILQPGPADGGDAGDRVAKLSAMVLDARMDAAVAQIDAGITTDREVIDLGVISGHEDARLGMLVRKSGRTTDLTRGVIDGVSLRTTINYRNGPTQAFRNQIHIVPRPPWPAVNDEISSGGDSGSVWINERNNKAIGLHFAGETSAAISDENAIANPIGPIMAQFNISFTPVICFRPLTLCERFPFICQIRIRDFLRIPLPTGPLDLTDPPNVLLPPLVPQGEAHDGGCSCTTSTAAGSDEGVDPDMTVGDFLRFMGQA